MTGKRIAVKRSFEGSRGGFVLFLWIFLRIVTIPTPAFAAIPPAGQLISSQSVATYDMGRSNLVALSNAVSLRVLPVYGPLLVPDGTVAAPAATARAFSGETVTFPYRLTNTGNDDDTIALSIRSVAPSDFVPASAAVYLDVDGDSLIDPGETVVTEVGPLASGETVSLVMAAELPAGLLGGETAHLDLMARSLGDTASTDEGNVVRIAARDEARVALILESDVPAVQPGETVTYTLRFSNVGERSAVDVHLSDYIDYNRMATGTEYVTGSVVATLSGTIEFFDLATAQWVTTEPAPDRVKGIRIVLASLPPGAGGALSFTVRVDADRDYGDMPNTAEADYLGGDLQRYRIFSNEVTVLVGRVSALSIGPEGNPAAVGNLWDCVTIALNGGDTTYTFWHEVLNAGNYTDTLHVVLADSVLIPASWTTEFVDHMGAPLRPVSGFGAAIGDLARDSSCVVGLRISSSPLDFRRFSGRELLFDVEAQSLVDGASRDRVHDVLIKTDIPLISVVQSIREPTALVGDILSFVVTVENLTDATTVDSLLLVENLSPGLGFAGGSDRPVIAGNHLRWSLGTLGPGEKREVVFRARVKAGQEWGRLVSNAYASGVTAFGEWTEDGPAQAAVQIVEGVFTRRGIISGSVFIDADHDGLRGAGEQGVRGASVFIEDGTFSVTDSSGYYSIPGVIEGIHVVRLDPASPPDSLVPADAGYFGLGVAGELLVNLAPSGNRRADFPLETRLGGEVTSGDASAASERVAPAVTRGMEPVTALPSSQEQRRTVDDGMAAGPPVSSGAGTESQGLNTVAVSNGVEDSDSTTAGAPDLPQGHFDGPGGSSIGSVSTDAGGGPGGGQQAYNALLIPSTLFAPGSIYLEDIPLREIAGLSLWLREHPDWRVSVEGHSDNVPISTAEFPSNFELSLARARAIYQLLLMNGVPADRMDYTGHGARLPVASNETPEGRAKNRRVEIKVVPPPGHREGDTRLTERLDRPDTTADDAGICAEIVLPEENRVFRSRDQIDVEIRAPLAADVGLYVNNVPVGIERIGKKEIDMGKKTITFVYYGVKIRLGENELLVVCKEHGGERSTCVRHVFLAGKPSGLIAEPENVSVPADGKSAAVLTFLMYDEEGLPVRDGIFATLEGPADLLKGLDANPHRSGVQVATENGRITVSLPPQRDPREARIFVSLDEDLRTGCAVSYLSPVRDWFLFGYGDGSFGYGVLEGTGSTHRTLERYHDGIYAEGKLSLYGQGEITEGHQLTCAIDTRPVREDKLFDRIEPEKYYPVYGDASELRFNSSSRSGTYLRLDHRRYYAAFGDFRTDFGSTEFARYHRSFNGLDGGVRFDRGSIKAFVTKTDQLTYQEEIPADGTSGFYFLNNCPLVENSEKVRIEVRDRYQSEKIIRIDCLQVLRDYDINYLDGSILFKEPVPAFDQDLNPVTIVVSYECRSSGEYNFTYGARGRVSVTDSMRMGFSAIMEDEGVETSSLVGVDLIGPVHPEISVEGEFAYSDKYLLGTGTAYRLGLRGLHDQAVRWNVYFRDIDKNFFNPSFSGGKRELGSRKYGGDLDWRVNQAFSVTSKAYSHQFQERSEKRRYADLGTVYRSGPLRGKAGLAGAAESDTRDGNHESMLLLADLGYERGKLEAALEWDQNIAGEEVQEYPNRLQGLLSWRFWRNVVARLKHEYRTGSRNGTRHHTQLGLESHVTENLHLYSRYRLEGAMSGERAQATIGIKNRFRLSPDLTATLAVEKLATVSGWRQDDFTSFAVATLYTPAQEDYQVKGNYELRLESARTKHLTSLAGIKGLGLRWAGLLKGDLWYSDEKVEMDQVKGSARFGLSFRPRPAGRLTLLSLLETRYEKNSPAHPGGIDKALVTSLEANYVIGAHWELEGKVAARWVRNDFKLYTASAFSFMYQGQLIRVIAERWDVGLTARIVHQRETGTVRYGGAFEVGRLTAENLWLGVGYSYGGHRDEETPINEFTSNGFYVRLRYKFNERLLKYFY